LFFVLRSPFFVLRYLDRAVSTPSRLVSVAVPVPALDLLTYRVPDGVAVPPCGARVLVPLGARRVTGIVTAHAPGGVQPEVVRDLADVLDAGAFLPDSIVGLAAWVAEYYACGPGDAMSAAMPPFAWVESELRVRSTEPGRAQPAAAGRATLRSSVLALLGDGAWTPVRSLAYQLEHAGTGRRGRPVPVRAAVRLLQAAGLVEVEDVLTGRSSAFRTARIAAITAAGQSALEALQDTADAGSQKSGKGGETVAVGRALGPKQRDALAALAGVPGGLDLAALRDRTLTADVVQRLAARGLVTIRTERVERDPFEGSVVVAPDAGANHGTHELTTEQAEALARLSELAARGTFATALVHGVTGSGKTELYLRLADQVRNAGRSVLVLVPEIGLTPALAGIFRSRFGDRLAIQHSGLSDGERHDQWHRIRRGDVDVVVGTRSAVFAPLASLGLVIVDEEHDGSYKQDENPRYNGRDVAIVRAKREGALAVLGSATPSLESYHNAASGRYALVTMARRVLDRPLAQVSVVNMREEYAREGPDVVLSRALVEAIQARLERGQQVLVLLNRRGYATAVFCRQCANRLECPNCSVSLTIHAGSKGVRRGRCHYCNYSVAVPAACPHCAAPYLEQTGFGTERVEQEVKAVVPGARVARLDRDTIRRRGAAAELLGRFARGEIDVLVGTQMIAKGHDFPRVTLVGVVSADVGLGLADFRAGERTFQLLTQVVGRAGRGEERGEAIIQTLFPEHYSIRHACRQDYPAFFEEELAFRRAMRYPPAVSLVNGIVRAPTLQAAMQDAATIVQRLQQAAGGSDVRVLGPAPAPFVKLRGEHRAQFFVKSANRPAVRAAIRQVLDGVPDLRRRLVIDVDPMSVL
jgi:primosomal protein N' (replication factor Y)